MFANNKIVCIFISANKQKMKTQKNFAQSLYKVMADQSLNKKNIAALAASLLRGKELVK